MSEKIGKVFNNTFFIILMLVLVSAPLRFINLGYSEYQDDEDKAIKQLDFSQKSYDFLINQRKGPMQFLLTSAISYLGVDPTDEFGMRVSFALASTGAVVMLFLFVKNYTKNISIAFFSAALFAVNGFFVGFGRIVQYQNLNLLFSFASLYFYSMLGSDSYKKRLTFSLLGTIFFCLSILSHWDAIFVLIPIIFFFSSYLISRDNSIKEKMILVLSNFVLGSLLLLPFMVPYLINIQTHSKNIEYFDKRVSINTEYTFDKHLKIFELYNPVYAYQIYIALGALSLPFVLFGHLVSSKGGEVKAGFFKRLIGNRALVILLWFILNLVIIRIFMVKPGTHIYNYVIPYIILCSYLFSLNLGPKILRLFIYLLGILAVGFLFFISYMAFIHTDPEYPWKDKYVFGLKMPRYKSEEVLTFGFPRYRAWKEVSNLITNDPDFERCSYTTNEGVEISSIYMVSRYRQEKDLCYFLVIIRRPFITTRDNYSYSETKNIKPIFTYSDYGENLTKVYKVMRSGFVSSEGRE